MLKRLFIGLLLLSGCSSVPVTVEGSVNLKHSTLDLYDLTNKERGYFSVWFCPKKVDIEKRTESARYLAIIQSEIEKIAKKECFKANTNIDQLTFSIDNLPSGRYTICTTVITRSLNNSELERLLWIKNININKSQKLAPLLIDDAYTY